MSERVIETVEGLEDLPVGSIVRAESSTLYVKERQYEKTGSWWVTTNEQFDFRTADIDLPVQVLYQPEGGRG